MQKGKDCMNLLVLRPSSDVYSKIQKPSTAASNIFLLLETTTSRNILLFLTLSKFWVLDKKNGTKVFMLKMWSHIHMKMIFNDFEIICWEILELFTDKVG